MATVKDKFTFKIILSYLVLVALAVVMSLFLYAEYKGFLASETEEDKSKKAIETGTLINTLYETDSFSRIALLTQSEEDYQLYLSKVDSLEAKIEEIKDLSTTQSQIRQLDSVKALLDEKNNNIEQLRLLKLTSSEDASLDNILREIKKLEISMGKNSLETIIKDPSKLSARERRVWKSYVDLLNSNLLKDTTSLKPATVDSMLTASRYIVSEAKRENSRIRRSLQQKENELIENDLTISAQLRQIIAAFDAEINRNNAREKAVREASVERTKKIFRNAGIIGALVVLLFSYLILTDFFRAEKFRRNLEKEKQYSDALLKSREQLISTVSHDLKTPLNTIIGYTELIENTALTEKQKYYSSQITSSAHFVSKLVDDLLDFSKLEAGKLPLESVPFALDNLIEKTAHAIKEMHSHKPIHLSVTIEEKLEGSMFEGDPLRIQQIVNNLIGNAFKFTEKGEISITVSEKNRTANTSFVEILVRDTGIGISKEKQELIFQEFTQAEADTAHKFGGSGLGLAISKKLTELLGGSLTVSSIPQRGSTFELNLPLKRTSRIVQKPAAKESKRLKKLSALIIDDDPAMVALLKELFQQNSMDCQAFTELKKLKQEVKPNFDFVLTDIQMPEISGFEVLSSLQANEVSGYEAQPVIAMTGSREMSREEYIAKGFADMLPKPFSKNQLFDVLSSLFSESATVGTANKGESIQPVEAHETYNLSMLASFVQSDAALEEILNVFYDQTKKDLLQIKSAVSTKNYKKIENLAHRMLTMFRQLEAKKVIPILEKLETTNWKISNEDTLNKELSNLDKEVEILLTNLQSRQ